MIHHPFAVAGITLSIAGTLLLVRYPPKGLRSSERAFAASIALIALGIILQIVDLLTT